MSSADRLAQADEARRETCAFLEEIVVTGIAPGEHATRQRVAVDVTHLDASDLLAGVPPRRPGWLIEVSHEFLVAASDRGPGHARTLNVRVDLDVPGRYTDLPGLWAWSPAGGEDATIRSVTVDWSSDFE